MKRKNLVMIVVFALIGLSLQGQVTFQKTFGGINNDVGYSVKQTSDGGYIITGYANDIADSGYSYGGKLYLIKTNIYGDVIWNKIFGDSSMKIGYSVQQTTDDGFIISGVTNSIDTGLSDVYLVKTNATGDTLWTKSYNNMSNNTGWSVQQTTDRGYIIGGTTVNDSNGNSDTYLIKTDSLGDTLWTKSFGGIYQNNGYSVQQSNDGGFIIVGSYYSLSTSLDVYLIKTDSLGDTLWTKTYGGTSVDIGQSVQQTIEGGFIIAGITRSFGAENDDVYLIKTNANGDTMWTKAYGGTGDDLAYSVQQTSDKGYIIAGETSSFGVGNFDVYLIRTDSLGDTLWTKTFGGIQNETGNSVQQTTDGGFIIVGSTNSFGAGQADVYLIKTDAYGNSGCNEGNTTTIVSATTTNIFNPLTIVSTGSFVNSTPTTVGSSGITTSLCSTEGINELTFNNSLLLSPNPFTTSTTLTLQGTYHNPSLFIYNLLGQEVRSIPVGTNNHVTINREHLASGMYFYKLIDENKEVLGIGKMIVE